MKLSNSSKGKTPVLKQGKLELYVTTNKGQITQYEIHNGNVTVVKVENGNFLAAWKKVEKIITPLLCRE